MNQQYFGGQHNIHFEVSVQELLNLAHYITLHQTLPAYRLSIIDVDINLRETSLFYIQRRKGLSAISKSHTNNTKPIEKNKASSASKSSIAKQNASHIPSYQGSNLNKSCMTKVQEVKSNEESSKSEGIISEDTKTKRKKIEEIPSKKSVQGDKISSSSLKEFEKDQIQQFQKQIVPSPNSKILLSQFIRSTKNNIPKEQNPTHKKQEKTQKSIQQIPEKIQSPPVPASSLKITPQKQINRSKSKTKQKVPKQSCLYKPSIKINGSALYGPQKLEPIFSQQLLNDYTSKHAKHPDTKIIKQNNIFKRKINVKCEQRVPIEIVPSSPQSDSPNYKESETDQKYQEPDYGKYKSYIINTDEKQSENELKGQEQEENKHYMDFYAIDISPCKGKDTHNNSNDMIALPQSLASKKQQSQQAQLPNKSSKSSRKRIFQHSSKPAQQVALKAQETLQVLNEQQMRMLLGVKGNKYKEAIVLQYIKDNRKCVK